MDLRQRLQLLRQLQRDVQLRSEAGAGHPAPAASAAPRPLMPSPETTPPAPAALPAGVAEHATAHGPVWWRERFYPADYEFGNQSLGAFAEMSPQQLALLARDPRLAGRSPAQLLLLDTETTGLSGGTGTVPFLIGIGRWQDGGLLVRQYFLPDFGYEQPMLAHLADTCAGAAGLVSFNGKTFDQPLLATRYVLQRSRLPLAGEPHLDLLHPARRLWRRRLGDCRLSTLERFVLGHEREGDVPGSLIPTLYTEYLQRRRAEPLDAVLEHNEFDLLAVAALTVHLATALQEVDRPRLHPLDELSRGHWLEQLGRFAAAAAAYREALSGELDGAARREALWRLAQVERRRGRHADAAAAWAELAASGSSVAALVELAKHYEHRRKDYRTALALTEQALQLAVGQRWLGRLGTARSGRTATDVAALRHRQARLQRKLARAAGRPDRPKGLNCG